MHCSLLCGRGLNFGDGLGAVHPVAPSVELALIALVLQLSAVLDAMTVTILFPHHSIVLFTHTCRLLTWRGRHHSYINTSYLFIHTLSSFCFLDLSMDIANS